MIDRSNQRLRAMIDLINDLLSISRRDLGSVRREIVPVDISDAVESVAEFLRGEMTKHKLRFVTDYAEALPTIDVDRDEFSRLLTNLFSNAIKYNRESGEIRVVARAEDDSVILRISDSGIGMTSEECAQLFRQFYRAKNEQTRSIPGTGLGLSIVKGIVESYHGNISVESVFGSGTTFAVRIPVHFVERNP